MNYIPVPITTDHFVATLSVMQGYSSLVVGLRVFLDRCAPNAGKRQYLGWHLPADTPLFGVDVDLYTRGLYSD